MLKAFILTVGLLTLAAGLHAAQRPNIVIVFTDDVGWGDLTHNRPGPIPTPNIDRLLARGRFCVNGYVAASICAPSRAALLTGRQPSRFGITGNHQPLPADERTLADVLKGAGYATACFGKWHLSGFGKTSNKVRPTQRGFDRFEGGMGHSVNTTPAEVAADVDKGLAFLRDTANRPSFLYLAIGATHTPLAKRDPQWLAKVDASVEARSQDYAACLLGLDAGIGRFMAGMDEQKLWSNTLVWFINDNGGKTSCGSTNAPLRAGKYSLYEGGIHVPFAVMWDGKLPQDPYTGLISALDVFPTSLRAAGVPIPTDRILDGKDLWEQLTGKAKPDAQRCLFWMGLEGGGAPACVVRCGRWKLFDHGTDTPKRGRGENKNKRKKEKMNRYMLYDLEADIGEQRDVASAQPGITKELRIKLEAWRTQLTD